MWVIVVGGAGLRAYHAANPTARQGADERGYTHDAIGLAHGYYPLLHWPPGAPALFSAAYLATGEHGHLGPKPDIPAAYWAQALAGTLLIVMTFALASLIAGRVAGAIAAAVVAVYPPLVVATGDLLSEPLAALLLTSTLATLVWAIRADAVDLRRLGLAGILLGAAALTRANLLALTVVLAAFAGLLTLSRTGWRRGVAAAGTVAAASAVLVAPWSIYVSRRAGEPVAVAVDGAYPFFVGTYLPGRGQDFWTKRALAGEIRRYDPSLQRVPTQRIPGGALEETIAARHPALSRDAALLLEARRNITRYIRTRPVAFARLLLVKIPRLWWNYSEGAQHPTTTLRTTLHRVLVVASSFALLFGTWRTRHAALLALMLVLATVTAVHMLAIAYPRYAMPLIPVLVSGGAAGAVLSGRSGGGVD